ncbi:MAG: hypothetical protein HYW34_03440 [Candidatus Brennerbacteria bacterium]|nr:hypothetical protein [Candidatus Brennerbacteria bacterium]
MVIFGGGNNGSMDVPQDAWILTNANGLGSPSEWHELSPSGSLPSRLERYAQAYDSLNNRFTVFGGCCFWINALRVLINAVSFNQSSWIQLFPSQPIPSIREVHAFAYDSNTNRLIIFGGGSFLGQFNDIWVLTNANGLGGPSKWHNSLPNGLSDSPPVPSVGVFSPAIYDSSTNRLSILYRPDDLWILTDANSLNHSFSGSFAQSTSFTPISFPTWPSSTSPFVEF